MQRKSVKSSVISSIGYDKNTETLEIAFKESGEIYRYFEVPKQVYDDLLSSESLGQYFNEYIKNYYEEDHIG